MRGRGKWLGLTVAIVLLAAACGGDGDDEGQPPVAGDFDGVNITFSTSLAEQEKAVIDELIGQFEDQTGATVNITAITSADLPQKLQVEVDSGNHTVHLFAQDNLALRVLVDENLVEDLSDFQLPEGINPAMIPEEFDGRQLFLPYRPNVRIAYVNRERFSAAGVSPPTTVDEFKSVAESLKTAGDGQAKVTLSLEDSSGAAAVTISEWIVSYGGDPVILNDEGSAQAFQFLQDMWNDGLLAQESLQGKFDTEVDYLRGETAWLAQNWPFTSGVFADEGLIDRFQIYEGWKGPVRGAHVIGGEVLGVPRGVSGRQKEAAVALAGYLMSKEAQEVLAERNAWPSVRDDAYGTVPEEQQETFTAIQRALADGWYRPNVSYWSDVDEAINEAIRRIIQGGEPVQPVLDELHDNIAAAAQAKGAEYPPSG
jgi:trehalose transport system substrate-binding protein